MNKKNLSATEAVALFNIIICSPILLFSSWGFLWMVVSPLARDQAFRIANAFYGVTFISFVALVISGVRLLMSKSGKEYSVAALLFLLGSIIFGAFIDGAFDMYEQRYVALVSVITLIEVYVFSRPIEGKKLKINELFLAVIVLFFSALLMALYFYGM